MNEKTDSLEQQLNSQINAELSSLWYYMDSETNSTRLIIKTITPCIKALIIGCPLKLLFGKKDNYLCIGVRIIDIPDGAMFISKVQYKTEEHRALIYALEKGKFDIALVNEMDKTVANGKVTIPKEKATEVLNWLNNESNLYVGPYTKEVEFAHDCFAYQ